MNGYPGSKAGAGVYQLIVNEMPAHDVYCEPFVGSGAIYLRKRPAIANIVADADAEVAARWRAIAADLRLAPLTVHHGDARSILADYGARINAGWLIYCDPPYVRSTRRQAEALYRHELTDQDHAELLKLLASLPARIMLSGYRCALYDQALASWRRIDYRAATRGGPVTESLWLNFPPVARQHDPEYLGRNYRERERIKRKQARWRARLAAMPPLERRAMLADLVALELASPAVAIGAGEDHTAAPGEAGRAPAAGSRIAAGDGGIH